MTPNSDLPTEQDARAEFDNYLISQAKEEALRDAAPDLLECCKNLAAAFDGLRPFPLVVEPVAAKLVADAREAIARATPDIKLAGETK